MKIYTRTGDAGQTGLLGGQRTSKHAPRIEAYGTVDELNAVLGVVRAQGPPARVDQILAHIQHELFSLGAELATPSPKGTHRGKVDSTAVLRLEEMIDQCDAELDPLRHFILPGGSPAAAQLHHARTVCRRAERRMVELSHCEGEIVSAEALAYANRLSDLLFVLARLTNAREGIADVKWDAP